jgi:hypothetical protein
VRRVRRGRLRAETRLAAYRAALLDAVDADVARLEVSPFNRAAVTVAIANAYNNAITDARAAIRAHKETTT